MRTKLEATHAEPVADHLVRFTGFTNPDVIEHGDGECLPLRGHEPVEVTVNDVTFQGSVAGMLRVNDELCIDVAMSPYRTDTLDNYLFDRMNERDPDLVREWMDEYAAGGVPLEGKVEDDEKVRP